MGRSGLNRKKVDVAGALRRMRHQTPAQVDAARSRELAAVLVSIDRLFRSQERRSHSRQLGAWAAAEALPLARTALDETCDWADDLEQVLGQVAAGETLTSAEAELALVLASAAEAERVAIRSRALAVSRLIGEPDTVDHERQAAVWALRAAVFAIWAAILPENEAELASEGVEASARAAALAFGHADHAAAGRFVDGLTVNMTLDNQFGGGPQATITDTDPETYGFSSVEEWLAVVDAEIRGGRIGELNEIIESAAGVSWRPLEEILPLAAGAAVEVQRMAMPEAWHDTLLPLLNTAAAGDVTVDELTRIRMLAAARDASETAAFLFEGTDEGFDFGGADRAAIALAEAAQALARHGEVGEEETRRSVRFALHNAGAAIAENDGYDVFSRFLVSLAA